ncbi:isoaspartyl peptidase/L-asparaginase family protein [Marinifilum caeruleilacunae]|uniref:Isoaspartyl peptidase/L-asparaginase n=1 Tax=Marinifilum caeruleilacunae TaxID=2499076 RepID=A0ABX1WXP8_9BACT|nr:isoaspartyl peptidase/L-asparaginase [Marinifilum caeruleilacunae]NOU60881.1 isoaspartyl peptidase/L-asparaginase [Marinifilum caeruleilacunae]
MKNFNILLSVIIAIAVISCKSTEQNPEQLEYALCIHGGAGTILKKNMTPEKEKAYFDKLDEALSVGDSVLKNGGSALDAVELTIHVLENSPLFNAGKGAVFTHSGKNELDASIMWGKDLNAGAVAGVGDIKNPISAARKVMENSEHVMLSGKGASEFAVQEGLEMVDSSFFFTEKRWNYLQKILKKEREMTQTDRHGTVGCVALDKNGNLAAGTSTGGMTNKKFGRIGDSPIIGAGTYANNHTCAVSCTGHGEFFIRLGVAQDIAAMMEYQKLSLDKATDAMIEKLNQIQGTGGFVALDKYGNPAMKMNTSGMYRGYVNSKGSREKFIYK